MLDRIRQDVRYAVRALARGPLFALVASLSIAIGVGATTAIVTLASTLLLRPPVGVGNPARVVTVGRTQDGRGFDNMSYPNFLDYRKESRTLTAVSAVRLDPKPVSLAGPAGGEPVQATAVSGNFFEVFQNTATQLIDIREPLREKIRTRFLAADAAGAEHCDLLFGRTLKLGRNVIAELAEGARARIVCAFKRADADLVGIARIEHEDVWVGNQRVPLLGLNVSSDPARGIGLGPAQGHDLALEPHLQAAKRDLIGV